MATKITHPDITGQRYVRTFTTGRKPLGLGKPVIRRLYKADEAILAEMKIEMGYLYNESQIVRDAVHAYLIYMKQSIP
jgi:hypothetical protein